MAHAVCCSSSSGTSPLASPVSMTSYDNQSDTFVTDHGSSLNGSDASNRSHTDEMGDSTPTPPQSNMPIAIVGMACRFPGNVASPAEFWELCARARSGFSPVPKDRFNHEAFYHPNPGKTGAYHAAGGYFLDGDLAAFDAPFFGLTEKEAVSMDPQQRLLLECTFEALENAGIPNHSIVGKDIGVFIGGSLAEYENHLSRDSDMTPMHQATGPSFTTDTACSSSLTTLHLACQSLRAGESTQAIVGGCHLNMLPDTWISFSTCRLLSGTGKSMAFDARGTGFGRGEGCGVIILKPLEQAVSDGDSIRAVIRGTGVNQDGKTPGITMPNGEAQVKLINKVYQNAGLDPLDCGFVEAHGTGTKVGDPIEATAISKALGKGRTPKEPLYLGSVKSNIGHLEAASGIAAVIKAAMMLERGFLLPNHDFKKPNDKIPLGDWNMKIPPSQKPWPKTKKYISINNFGFGGTNAHVVLGKAALPPKAPVSRTTGKAAEAGRKLFIMSANDKHSLAAVMKKMVIYLEQRPEIFQSDLLNNLSYTLGQRRSLLQWRVAIPAATSFDLIESLNSSNIMTCRDSEPPRIGFVFTGQGAQWYGMGRELYAQYPVYADAIDRADDCLRRLGAKWSLIDELGRDAATSKVSEAHISQPSCTAVQLALTDLLHTWGIRPVAVAGHSSGEIGAAYAAGIISFESAMAIAYHRGCSIPILKEKFPDLAGAMMAVGGTKEEIQPMIDALQEKQVQIACYNSPKSLTISGDTAALNELDSIMEKTRSEMFHRRLQVDVAYHSHHMNLIAEEYREAISKLPLPRRKTSVRFHSSLYGQQVQGSECKANYWVENLTCPVRFSEALETMLEPVADHKTGVDVMIELGPHSALQGPIKQILKSMGDVAAKIQYTSPLVRNKDAVQTALELAASLLAKGTLLRMEAINFPKPTKKVLLTDLPRYPWNHEIRYWHDSRMAQMHRNRSSPRHDLIGVEAIYSSDLEPTWRNIVCLDDLPWLRHHKVQSVTIFPISGFIAMALEASAQWAQRTEVHFDKFELRDVTVVKPLALSDSEIEMTITLKPQTDAASNENWNKFVICSWSQGTGWTEHCVGFIATQANDSNDVDNSKQKPAFQHLIDLVSSATKEASDVGISDMYEQLSSLGVAYGPTFRGLTSSKASHNYSVGIITAANVIEDMPNHYMTDTILHPTLLESVIEMYWPILAADQSKLKTIYLPSSVSKLSISRNITTAMKEVGSRVRAYCKSEFSTPAPRPATVSILATDCGEFTDPLIEIEGLTVSPILDGEAEQVGEPVRELCYKVEWEPVAMPEGVFSLPDVGIAIIHGESSFQQVVANQLAIALERQTLRLPDMGTLFEVDATGKVCIILTEIDQPFLASMSEKQFTAVQMTILNGQGLLWVTRGAYDKAISPESNLISGLSRSVRSETLLPLASLDLDGRKTMDDDGTTNAVMHIFNIAFGNSLSPNGDLEFMERSGNYFTPRVVNDGKLNEYIHRQTNPSAMELQSFVQDSRPLRMEVSESRSLETLHFVDDPMAQSPLEDDEVEFEVRAIGMNTSFIKGHVQNHNQDKALGLEASGVVSRVGASVTSFKMGDHIAALTMKHGAYRTRTRTTSSLAIPIPTSLSWQDAATLPLSYCTAYYGLVEQARLRQGQKVLITSACGSVGQAAISIAQTIGAEVIATVGSAEKKAILVQEYGLLEEHIFYSHSASFGTSVRKATQGQGGVDVVLNLSTSPQALRESWACLNRFGSLVQVGRRHESGHCETRLDTRQADSNACFMSVDMLSLATERPQMMEGLVADVTCLLLDGKIRPVMPVTTFSLSDLQTAFKHVQSPNKGPGKVVIVPKADDLVMATTSKASKQLLRSDSTYVLIGGTGGLGRSMAGWMIDNGARNIVLVSRSGVASGKVKELIDDAFTLGASIVVRSCNVADKASVDELLTDGLEGLPAVRGVVHGAMVLRDVLFEKMTWQDYTTVLESKVHGAWNFHHGLRDHKLDFFVAISSAAGMVGNRGQAAYAAANTFLNAFVQHRLAMGLPAVSLDLTAVSDAGYLAEDKEKADEVARNLGSDSTICEAEVLALLGAAITGQTTTCNNHVITGMRIAPMAANKPFWTNDAKFKTLRLEAEAIEAEQQNSGAGAAVSINAELKAAKSLPEAEDVVCRGLVDKIAQVLMMEQEHLDVTRSLSHYPLDSLVAIEIRNFIARNFEANMQVLELLSSGSIQTLSRAVCAKSKLCLNLLG